MLSGVILVAGLTACGSDKADSGDKSKEGSDKAAEAVGSPLAALKLASKQTDQQHSAKVEGTTQMGAQNSTMSGAMDWANGMHANMVITQKGGSVQNSPLAGKPMEARYTPDAMFMNLGPEFAAQAGGKHWMKYDYDTLAKQAGASGEFLKDQMQNTDPARSVQLLIATGQVKSVGTESVKGVKATHYTGTVKVSELAKMQSKDLTQSDLEALQKQLETSGMETETIDLWIDGDNLLVKKREQAESNNGKYDSTVFYSDYGTKVTVEEPPASDTMDFQDALRQQS
ncbi:MULTISPECIES: hypothetical protein [unclassified Streptomyces]|uniref:hypothetical protein n=1 Tax=unclassified Streptomyces TaxID=2593676 RepID=UPI00336AB34B